MVERRRGRTRRARRRQQSDDVETGLDECDDWTGITVDDGALDVPSVDTSPRKGEAGDEYGR